MFHERLRALREKRGMTQDQLAQLLDVSADRVRDWEQPHARRPDVAQVLAIAQHLRVTVDDLLGFADRGRGAEQPGKEADPPAAAIARDPSPPAMLPVSLLQKLCTLRAGELDQVEAYIDRLIAQQEDYYIY